MPGRNRASPRTPCPCGAASSTAHPRPLDGTDLSTLNQLDPAGLTRLLLDAVDSNAGRDTALLVVCVAGRAQLGALLETEHNGVARLGPLLVGVQSALGRVGVVLNAAAQIARQHGCADPRLTVLATDLTVLRVADEHGYELTGASSATPRPELGIPASDTWTMTRQLRPTDR